MSQVVIENPIINSPFDEPTRHFRFSDEGYGEGTPRVLLEELVQFRQDVLAALEQAAEGGIG